MDTLNAFAWTRKASAKLQNEFAHRPANNKEQQELLDLLLHWSEQVIEFEF